MKSKSLTVLVVSGGSFQGLTVIKGLRYSDSVRIIMTDSSDENLGRYFVDCFYRVPEVAKKEQFLESLLGICNKEKVDIIIPSTNIELLLLAENLELFIVKNIRVAVSDLNLLTIVSNKLSLYRFLTERKIPVLPILDIRDNNLKFPIIGKPVYGWGSRDMIILISPKEMYKYKFSVLKKDYVWQPYLKDYDEFSIDSAIDFEGNISEFVIRQRVKTVGGFAVITEGKSDSMLKKMSAKLLNLIKSEGGRGIFNIQILRKGHKYFVSDINPRIGTSAVFAYKLGINFPLFLCSAINQKVYNKPQSVPKAKKIKMVRYLEELWIEKENPAEIKGIVFDLDDTLINQKIWIISKLEALWSKFISILPEKEEFLLKAIQIIEEGNRSKVFDALSQEFHFTNDTRKRLIEDYRKIEPEHCPLFPDALPTLKELKRIGFKLALLTDNPPESQKQKIKVCNLDKIFDLIIYTRELNQEKPNKIVFNEAARLLKIPVNNLIMVGDHLYKDIVGALEANYRTAYWLVRNGIFLNFEQRLFDKLFGERYNFKKINNLRHLLWVLER